jgi:8-oxo-dGTP diphosphatase
MSFCLDVTLPPEIYAAKPLLLVVAGILIDADGRLLIASRPEGKALAGLWEFPGGKIAPNESAEQALVRELDEELGIKTSIGCLSPLTFLTHSYDGFHLLMPLFTCRNWRGMPQAQEGQQLAWVTLEKITDYNFVPADRPLLPRLRELL